MVSLPNTFPLTKLARPRSASLALISSDLRIPHTIILALKCLRLLLLPSLRLSSVGDLRAAVNSDFVQIVGFSNATRGYCEKHWISAARTKRQIQAVFNLMRNACPSVQWCTCVRYRTEITRTHTCMASKWTFLARTIPDISNLFQPLEDVIRQRFLPVLTGQSPFSDSIRDLMVLPTRLGGLGIENPVMQATKKRDTSCKVTAPLVNLIVEQSKNFPMEALEEQTRVKYDVSQAGRQAQASIADSIYTTLPNSLQKAVEISKESGASTWLTALLLEEHGFALHKGAFRGALCLRYGWRPPLLPSQCVCDKTFSVEHALSCPHGGFPTICHNEIRDITAHLMSHNVGIEPPLQHITSETMSYRTANVEEGARLDIKAQGF